MPEGFIRLLRPPRQVEVRALAERRRMRVEVARDDWTYYSADVAPRPTVRQEAFGYGDDPLPRSRWPGR